MNKTFISTAIDYVNAFPHIGHALEKIFADVLARRERLLGKRVFFLSGTDENSLKNVRAAENAGISVNELVAKNADKFFGLKSALDLSFDDFIRTTEKRHVLGVQKLWEACKKDIFKKKYSGLYCVACETFYKEDELQNGLCPVHLTKPEIMEEENYFFRLSKYEDYLKDLIKKEKIKIIPQSRKNEILAFIKRGLEDICVSRSSERARSWGIDVPGDPSQKIWVWFDALSNYITALDFGKDGGKFRSWWQENDKKIHVVGKDILKFHAVYWPAILFSAGLNPPDIIFAHGFITVGGQKMSKSLGNVIDPFELVKKYGADGARYFFLAEFPTIEDGDFTYEKFEQRYNSDLANGVGNLFERVLSMVSKYGVENVKAVGADQEILDLCSQTEKSYSGKMVNFQFYDALKNVLLFVGVMDKYINDKKPWSLLEDKSDQTKKILSGLILSLGKIVFWLKPFMPLKMEEAERYIKNLGEQKERLNLFPRIQ
ncbi:methionine--tRNA ligase [Candidatus Wolfebacteria bacterium RBG_13_41_7]|uniref:methionine--tRNA ligase n=1 Tax=Candidatus Wolfebacteria bacterium RBG_13_41_7 TaxID=1802554 RepID=A0A1F8DL61_9BACT|nr:MAG: methionine--tRNA ligase [Candidatus Wolfebacteria bacterium RBG_13_41_7]